MTIGPVFQPDEFFEHVHIIGVGGIGTRLVQNLVPMGLPDGMTLWDHDRIEERNIGVQPYFRHDDIGRYKTDVVAEELEAFPIEVRTSHLPVAQGAPLDGVVFVCVDSIDERRIIWEVVQENLDLVPFMIDGRVSGHSGEVLCVTPSDLDDVDHYEGTLVDPEYVAEEPCATGVMTYTASAVAAFMAAQFARRAMEMEVPRETRINLFKDTVRSGR